MNNLSWKPMLQFAFEMILDSFIKFEQLKGLLMQLLLGVFLVPSRFGLIKRIHLHLLYWKETLIYVNINRRMLFEFLEDEWFDSLYVIRFCQLIHSVCELYVFFYLNCKSIDERSVLWRKLLTFDLEITFKLNQALCHFLVHIFIWRKCFLNILLQFLFSLDQICH